ncbi:MAG: hypothetical protein VX427_13890 [Acidobacteriota bacterium]|nr:hypothetical protein [Acidobacteriota bacterium]
MTSGPRRRRLPVGLLLLGFGVGVLTATSRPASAQAPARGQNIAPVYEGFWKNDDGSFDLLFGYYNRNWEEEIDVPVGPNNFLEPGPADKGQPAHFFPRRNQFVFRVRVPADFGDQEVVWTLTTNGVTEKAFGTLRPAYVVDEVVMAANFGAGGQTGGRADVLGNTAPELTLESANALSVRVGEPLDLSAVAVDDGKPTRRPFPVFLVGQSHFVPNSATGLRFSWFRYRGPGPVVFDPPQTKVWEDTRDGGESPWSAGWSPPPLPPDNRWTVQATFSEPGTYVLRALAHDGGLVDYEDVTVTVQP